MLRTTIQIRPGEGKQVVVVLPYSPERVAKIRTISGRRWHPEERYWTVPASEGTVERLLALFEGERVEIDPALRPLDTDVVTAVEQELTLRGYSPKTQKAYRLHIEQFLRHVPIPRSAREDDVRAYILALNRGEGRSASYVNQAISAIKFLYGRVLHKPEVVQNLPRPRGKRGLPVVLSREEIIRLFRAVENLKHRTILMVIYAAGLRVSEVVRLRVSDIDKDRRQIRIRQGKGKKDRYTVLSEVALMAIQEYREVYHPTDWLFPGARPGKHLTARTVEHVFRAALERAEIEKDATVHTLRHSFATHLHEAGTDIRYIQELLGHARLETTRIYTHVSRREVGHIRSPLDDLDLKGGEQGEE
jgi:site-specific recombinase XerD